MKEKQTWDIVCSFLFPKQYQYKNKDDLSEMMKKSYFDNGNGQDG
jgi:hypothetical protein